MPCLEFEGKSVEKAVKKASEKLKIPLERLKYDVISYGSTGIFGLVGSKKARICIKLQETIPKAEMILKEEEPVEEKEKDQVITEGQKKQKAIDDPIELGRNVLERIIDSITENASVSVQEDADRILFNISGGNSAILIGRRGQTLEAIQYLLEKVINKNYEQRIRIQVDIEGYLESKKGSLERIAVRLSEKAKRTGKPVTIGQLNAHDRRIIHLALKDDAGVRTQSMGNGFYRKLVIFPKKNYQRKKERNV
jgi:spoIIIJ-associated protein